MKLIKFNALIFLALILAIFATSFVSAQVSSSGVAITAAVNDSDAQDGDIICTYPEGNLRCDSEYDPSLFGVISDNPAAAIEDSELEDGRLIVTSGIATVRVSSANGNIAEGEFLTSSETPGVAMRADRNGYVLGVANEDYESGNPEEIGRMQVLVNVHPAAGIAGPRGDILRFIREGITFPVTGPLESLRYLLAALMVILAFSLGMIYFGRASREGIEAVGRNPLAKRVIQLTVILNIVLTIVIVLVGLGISYIILIL